MGVDHLGSGVGKVGAGILQIGDVDAREPGDLDILGGQEPLPVEGGGAVAPAVAFRSLE